MVNCLLLFWNHFPILFFLCLSCCVTWIKILDRPQRGSPTSSQKQGPLFWTPWFYCCSNTAWAVKKEDSLDEKKWYTLSEKPASPTLSSKTPIQTYDIAYRNPLVKGGATTSSWTNINRLHVSVLSMSKHQSYFQRIFMSVFDTVIERTEVRRKMGP